MTKDPQIPVVPVNGLVKNSLGDEMPRSEPSFSQERLWFLDKYENEENVAYNESFAVTIEGNLDFQAFERALNEIYSRHEVLRAFFAEENSRLVQVVQALESFPLTHVDLRHLSEDALSNKLDETVTKGIIAPFRLASGPLVRGFLIRLKEESHVFLVVIHHIITDGWSIQIFRSELSALYSAYAKDQASTLKPLYAQYSDYTSLDSHGHVPS